MNKLTAWNPFRERLGAKAIFAAMAGVALLSGCATVDLARSSGLTPTEKMMWSTYALATPKGMATCIIVNRPDPSVSTGILPVLITSAHVLASAPHGPFYVVFRERHPDRNPTIGVLEFTSDPRTKAAFFLHPSADIAVLELRIPSELANRVTLPSFIDERTIGRAADQIRVGDELLVLGFPHVFPGTEGGFPILRSGRMASYSIAPASDREQFMINTTVFGGDSGAPVFAIGRGNQPKLVGMISQRIGEKEAAVPFAVAANASVVREALDLEASGARVELGPIEPVATVQANRKFAAQLAGPAVPWSRSPVASLKVGSGSTKASSVVSPPQR